MSIKTRSRFEAKILDELREDIPSIDLHYESNRLGYTVPARQAHYVPDLYWPDQKLVIELKGRFRSAAERQKYIHFRNSNPHIEIRFVLQRANVKLMGSKTTQEAWLAKNGFTYAVGSVPKDWIA